MKLEFYRQTFEKKNTQISNFMKIRPVVGPSVVPCGTMDGQAGTETDMTKLTAAFLNVGNTPKTY